MNLSSEVALLNSSSEGSSSNKVSSSEYQKEWSEEWDKDKGDGKESGCNNSSRPGYTNVDINGTEESNSLPPESAEENDSLPLLLNFHGFGGCASYLIDEAGDLNEVAGREKFAVAYMQATEGSKGSSYWSPGDYGDKESEVSDIVYAEKVIEEIASNHPIDLSKVYAPGYSNGGMMSYGLACQRGELFAAIGIMSGVMLDDTCDESQQTSVIHFHGTGDAVLPLGGDENYQSTAEVISFWLSHNGIDAASKTATEYNEGGVLKEEYQSEDLQKVVTLYTVRRENGDLGGHVWFTADIDGESPNQILWDFLSRFSLE